MPSVAFDTSLILNRIVNREACIEYLGYFYRIPIKYIGQTCVVKIKDNQLYVYDDSALVINHPLAEKGRKNRYIGVKQRTSKATAIVDSEQVKQRLMEIGDDMRVFIDQMKKDNPKNYLCHLRGILSLKVNYTNDDILFAVRRAIKYRVFDAAGIETFLEVNATKKNEVILLPSKKINNGRFYRKL